MRKLVKLGEITDSCLGKMLDAEKNTGELQPYLANINVRWGDFDTDTLSLMRFEDDEDDRYGIQKGDLIVCEGGEPGRCAIWDGAIPGMKIQKALHRVRAHEGIDIRFIYYWFLLAGQKNLLRGRFTGSTIKHLPEDMLKDIEIYLPEYQVQNKIANLLSIIDSKIKNNRSINNNLQQQLRLLYDYWFTQFDFPDENGKPYRATGGKMVWNEALKKYIPKNWHCAFLRDILQPSGIGINSIDGNESLYYTPVDIIPQRTLSFAGGLDASEANSSLQLYDVDDILLGAMRVYFHRVCIAAQKGITRTTTMILKPVNGESYLGYAYAVLNDDRAILYANQNSSGTQQPYINWNDALEKYPFAAPNDSELMLKYSQIVRPLIKENQKIALENCELQKLRDWLLPLLMNGQATIDD